MSEGHGDGQCPHSPDPGERRMKEAKVAQAAGWSGPRGHGDGQCPHSPDLGERQVWRIRGSRKLQVGSRARVMARANFPSPSEGARLNSSRSAFAVFDPGPVVAAPSDSVAAAELEMLRSVVEVVAAARWWCDGLQQVVLRWNRALLLVGTHSPERHLEEIRSHGRCPILTRIQIFGSDTV